VSEPQAPIPAYVPSGPSGPRASFGRRLVALLIDGVLVAIVYGIVYAIVGETSASLVTLAVWFAYFTFFEGSPSGQTIGKRALGIRVIDFRAGGPIGFARGLGRTAARILSGLVCYLGYFWMLWDGEKQTWHDKLATTVVVPVAYYPVDKWPG
jgi:uncharacterized RDD family membrane protein YckC